MILYDWLKEATKRRGSAKALVYRDTYLSWRGLLHRVDRRAHELAAMNIGEGSWVGLMLGNVPDFLILALALSKLDACLVPLDPTTGSRELDILFDLAPMRALITRPRGGDIAQQPTTPPITRPIKPPPPKLSKSEQPETRRRLQGTLLTCASYKVSKKLLERQETKRARLVIVTSDSGGEPKGVFRESKSLAAEAELVAAALELNPEDRVLIPVPLFGAYGFDMGLLAPLCAGSTLYLEDEVSAKRIAKVIREQEITFMPGVPGLYQQLAKIPTARPLKTKNIRFVSSGSRLEESVADSFRERYGVRLVSLYHTTEAGMVAVDKRAQNPTTVGKPPTGVDVAIRDAESKNLGTDEPGHVWVRSKALCDGAVSQDQDEDAKDVKDAKGWLRTGDRGQLDKSGRLHLLGRADDLVKVDGKRIALGEVEGCIASYPKVKQAQALVIDDPLVGPVVIARVVVSGRIDAEDIIDHCAKNLAPYKVPRRIEFCDQLDS